MTVWLLGLCGLARSGKDTVAGILDELGGYKRVAFADPLKGIALAVNPYVFVEIDKFCHGFRRLREVVGLFGWDVAKQQVDVRRLLQLLGTEGVREHLGDDAWIIALGKKLADLTGPTWTKESVDARFVVTDVRFPNESDAIKKWGGAIWRVERPDAGAGANSGHASEKLVESIRPDVTIDNSGTIDELKEKIRAALGGEEVGTEVGSAVVQGGTSVTNPQENGPPSSAKVQVARGWHG